MSIYIPSHLLGRIPIKIKTDGKCPFISLSHEHDWNTNQKYNQATKFTKTEIEREQSITFKQKLKGTQTATIT